MLTICNIYCFYTATMVIRKGLIVTLYVHCMFWYFYVMRRVCLFVQLADNALFATKFMTRDWMWNIGWITTDGGKNRNMLSHTGPNDTLSNKNFPLCTFGSESRPSVCRRRHLIRLVTVWTGYLILCAKVVRLVVLCSTVVRSLVLCSTVVRFVVMCAAVVRFVVLCSTVVRSVVLCSTVVRSVVLCSTVVRFVVLCSTVVRIVVLCVKIIRFVVTFCVLSVTFKVPLIFYSILVSVFLKSIILSNDNHTFRKGKPKNYNIMPIRPFPLPIYRCLLKYFNLLYSSGCSRICQNNLEISKKDLVACLMILPNYLSGGRRQKLIKHQSNEYLVANYKWPSCGCKTRSFNLKKSDYYFGSSCTSSI